jgi:hypothetical protein
MAVTAAASPRSHGSLSPFSLLSLTENKRLVSESDKNRLKARQESEMRTRMAENAANMAPQTQVERQQAQLKRKLEKVEKDRKEDIKRHKRSLEGAEEALEQSRGG